MRIFLNIIKWFLIVVCALILIAVTVLSINGRMNDKVRLTEYTFSHPEIPRSFDGYRIMVISDLHNAPFSDQIIEYIRNEEPDLVVFTGDMVQLPYYNVEEASKITKAARSSAVLYAISGNHESQNECYEDIMGRLWGDGAPPLENDSVEIEKDGESILLVGARDPKSDVLSQEQIDKVKEEISEEITDPSVFTVVLNHRADLYPEIKDCGGDLILAGHLHGGIIRLPFVGGVIGQDTGEAGKNTFFPKYDYGYFKEGDGAAMIVSGGCDQNPDKARFFNPPEVVLVKLEAE